MSLGGTDMRRGKMVFSRRPALATPHVVPTGPLANGDQSLICDRPRLRRARYASIDKASSLARRKQLAAIRFVASSISRTCDVTESWIGVLNRF